MENKFIKEKFEGLTERKFINGILFQYHHSLKKK